MRKGKGKVRRERARGMRRGKKEKLSRAVVVAMVEEDGRKRRERKRGR